jgi:hypothetical protein
VLIMWGWIASDPQKQTKQTCMATPSTHTHTLTPPPSSHPHTPPPPQQQQQTIALRVLTATLQGSTSRSLHKAFPSLSEARAFFPHYVFPELHRLAADPQVSGRLDEIWVYLL